MPDTPLARLHRLMMKNQLFDVEILREAMRANLGDMTFQEAFNRTRFILNITVSSSTLYDMPRLLNYITAPDVVCIRVIRRTCFTKMFCSIAYLVCSVSLNLTILELACFDDIYSAASCAVPVFYGSTPLFAKDRNGNVMPWNPNGE